jgi:hypothetical protein
MESRSTASLPADIVKWYWYYIRLQRGSRYWLLVLRPKATAKGSLGNVFNNLKGFEIY